MPPSLKSRFSPPTPPRLLAATALTPFALCSPLVGTEVQAAEPAPPPAGESRQSTPSSIEPLQEVVIWGRAERLIGTARSASEGVVGYADFSTRPLLRVAELTEVVPGMIATAHSGSGKANQYFLRGINLDHGSDFAATLDGVPVNFPSHAHAQGYLDLNFLIPEIVRTVEYRKGTHHADLGDFSAAGAAAFTTYDRLDAGFIELNAGSEEHFRLVAADSFDAIHGTFLYAAEVQRDDGPWVLEENLRKLNLFLKYSTGEEHRRRSVQLTAYDADWRATDQIPLRAVESGLLDRFGYVDPDLGGSSKRIGVSGRIETGNWSAIGYVTRYELNLFSNPTYALSDPELGDEIEQEDRRWVAGGSLRRTAGHTLGTRPLTLEYGADVRYDDVGELNLFRTAGRRRIGAVREDEVRQLTGALHAAAELQWTDRLRVSAGIRGDLYDYRNRSAIEENSGSGTASIVSPKLGFAFAAAPGLELYANAGRGFHSNDVRGVTLRVDPVTGDPVDPVPALVRADGYEVGVRWEHGETLRMTLTAFRLALESELQFVGDAGTSEPKGASTRRGVELTGFWRPIAPLVFDLTAAATHARFDDASAGGRHIPNALDSVIGAGVTYVSPRGLLATLRVRHMGPAPLVEDNSVRAPSMTLVNAGLGYDFGRWSVGLDLLNLLDERGNDIIYYFESQLPWETQPVEDLHFHPVEPREVRVRFAWRF